MGEHVLHILLDRCPAHCSFGDFIVWTTFVNWVFYLISVTLFRSFIIILNPERSKTISMVVSPSFSSSSKPCIVWYIFWNTKQKQFHDCFIFWTEDCWWNNWTFPSFYNWWNEAFTNSCSTFRLSFNGRITVLDRLLKRQALLFIQRSLVFLPYSCCFHKTIDLV